MNALELIHEAERIGYALGVKNPDKLSMFVQWVITLKWPKIVNGRVEEITLEELKAYFPTVKSHPKNKGES